MAMEPHRVSFIARLVSVFLDQLSDGSSSITCSLEEVGSPITDSRFHEMESLQELQQACQTVEDAWKQRIEGIRCSEQKYLLALFVAARLDQLQEKFQTVTSDTPDCRMGKRLREVTPCLNLSRNCKFRDLLTSTSETVQSTIYLYVKKCAIDLAIEMSSSDLTTPPAGEEKVRISFLDESARQFFAYVRLYFAVCGPVRDHTVNPSKIWEPLVSQLKWTGRRDAFVGEFRNFLMSQNQCIIPLSGAVFLTIAKDVLDVGDPRLDHDSINEVMRDVEHFYRDKLLNNQHLMEVAEEFWVRYDSKIESNEVFNPVSVTQLWVPLLAFFVTYFWEKKLCYVKGIVNKIFQKQSSFLEIARVYHMVVDRMQCLFWAKEKTDHKKSLKALSETVFAASRLSRPSETVSSEDILACYRSQPESHEFCQFILLKCFDLRPGRLQLTFGSKLVNQLTSTPHNRRICKQFAQLLDEAKGWGLTCELNEFLQAIFQLLHMKLKDRDSPSRNASVFKFISYSKKYLQCTPASHIEFKFRICSGEVNLEDYLLREVPEAMRAFRRCSDIVAHTTNCLPVSAWNSYCLFAAKILEGWASVPDHLSRAFISKLLSVLTVDYGLPNLTKATLYQEFFKALRTGCGGKTINIPSGAQLLEAMYSIYQIEKEDPSAHEPRWMQDFDQLMSTVREEVDDLNQLIRNDRFSFDQLQTLLNRKDEVNGLLKVFGLPHPQWKQLSDFDNIRQKLTMVGSLLRILLMHPFQRNEVQNVVHELDKILVVSDATFERLRQLEDDAESLLGPLYGELLENSLHMNARTYLEYFEKTKNALFEGCCQAVVPLTATEIQDLGETWYKTIAAWLRDVHRKIKMLLHGSMKLSEIPQSPKFREVLYDRSRLEHEMEILGFHPYYKSAKERTSNLCESLRMARLIVSISQLVETLRMMEVVDENDEDFAFVVNIAEQTLHIQDLTLVEIRSKEAFQKLSRLFSGLLDECIDVMKEAGKYAAVVKFFRDHDFHSESGITNFLHIKENMTMRVRGNAFKSDLLSAVIVCRECVEPLRSTKSPLKHVIATARGCSYEWREATKFLQLVNENMVQVQRMFSKEMASAHDDATEQACLIANSGVLELSLRPSVKRLQRCKLMVRSQQSSEPVLLRGEEIETFNLHLAFESNSTQTGDNQQTLSMVVDMLGEVLQIGDVSQQLIDLSHPRQRESEPIIIDFNPQHISALRKDLEDELERWNKTLELVKEKYNILKLLSKDEVAHMMDLLIEDKKPETVTAAVRRFMSYIYSISRAITSETDKHLQDAADIASQVISTTDVSCDDLTEVMKERLVSVMSTLTDIKLPQQDNRGTLFACRFTGESLYSTNVLLFLVRALSSSHKLLSHCQILWCSHLTSSAELQSFCDRITTCSGVSFAFVGVDCLSLEKQQELESHQQQLRSYSHNDVYFLSVDVGPGQLHPYDLIVYEDVAVKFAQVRESWRALQSDLGVQTPVVTVVCGAAGSGKTSYIGNQIAGIGWISVRLTMNEAVEMAEFIQQLSNLPDEAIVFITISAQTDPSFVNKVMFSLFVCGTLYDDRTHSLFTLPKQSRWQVFIEVPFENEWKLSCNDVLFKRFPMVYFLADTIKRIDENTSYFVESDELQLAKCVDMLSHWSSRTAPKTTGFLTKELPDAGNLLIGMNSSSSKFTKMEAQVILKTLAENDLPSVRGHDISRRTVVHFFYKLLSKRFAVFSDPVLIESVRHPNYRRFPAMLYRQFVKEAAFLCTPHLSCSFDDWSQPLLNFCTDSNGVSFYPLYKGNSLPLELSDIAGDGDEQLRKMSVKERLGAHLGWMLSVPSTYVHTILDKRRFVLTDDYCYKMILIHQRKCACVPLIIEGETGVGKTYLLETYAELLNWQAYEGRNHVNALQLSRRVSNWMRKNVLPMLPATLNMPYQLPQDLMIENFDDKGLVEQWIQIAERLNISSRDQSDEDVYDKAVQSMIQDIRDCYHTNPLLKPAPLEMAQLLDHERRLTVEESSLLLRLFLNAPRHSLFFKLLVHPGLQPTQIFHFLSEPVQLARKVDCCWTVVVFFDEVNTASCPGVLKEIIVDHTMRGRSLPNNLFIVAAINPYNKACSSERKETAFPLVQRRDYNVTKLPYVMDSMLWKYGEFNIQYAKTYIRAKIRLEQDLLDAKKPEEGGQKDEPTMLISPGLQEEFTQMLHTAIRFCSERLGENSVSQRDVQRVFTLLPFVYHHGLSAEIRNNHSRETRFHEALCLVIGLAFVWKLPVEKADEQDVTRGDIFGQRYFNDPSIAKIIQRHVDAFVTPEHFHLPEGIALTQALKENVFAVVAAVQTGVPLSVIGAPGLSKTLSFQIARDNLKGPKFSPREFCRQFSAIDTFYHHCSEFSEASHIELTFHKAIERQKQYNSMQDAGYTRCVVFLDDSGLPNEKKMILKCLHPFLDEPRVSFVAASNRAFDAANANRMITVYRSRLTSDDHYRLAVGCLGLEDTRLSSDGKRLVRTICSALSDTILAANINNRKPFHYRDFIHVFRCLHRHFYLTQQPTSPHLIIDPRLLLRSLEENLNGLTASDFNKLVTNFFNATVPCLPDERFLSLRAPYQCRNTVTILKELEAKRLESKDKLWTGHLLAPRFTMIIDPTDDLSTLQLLFHYGLLNHSSCRVFRISEFPEDRTDMQTVKTLTALCYALEEETTAVFVNCKRLEGSLYELLNQSFRGWRQSSPNEAAYANIAVGASVYPCKVNPLFHCVVIMTEQDALKTPAPFLSRFAKFRLSPSDFLQWRLQGLPAHVSASVDTWTKYARAFIDHYGQESFVGLNVTGTIDLTVLSGLNWKSLFTSFEQMARLRVSSYHSQSVIQTYVRDDTEWSKVAVVSRLLQLATPESIILNFDRAEPSYRRLMASLYFGSARHCDISSVVSQLLSDRTRVQDGNGKSTDLLSTRKYLLYSRSTRSLYNVSQNVAELFGQQNVSRLSVASDLKSRDVIARFLETFLCDDSKTIAVIVVDVLSAIDVGLLCQLIDDADHLALSDSGSLTSKFIGNHFVKGRLRLPSSRAFLLILHFPGEQIFAPGVTSAKFMDGWDTFFMEQTDTVSRQVLREIATTCAHTADDMTTDTSSFNYSVAMTNVICEENVWDYLLDDSVFWFCSRIRMINESNVNLVDHRLVATVKRFYTKMNCPDATNEKMCCLKSVLTTYPGIEETIQQQVVKICNVSVISKLLTDSSHQVFGKMSFFALADLLLGHLKQFTREVFSSILLCLTEDFTLSTLMQVSNEDQSSSFSADLLKFLLTVGLQKELDRRRQQPLDFILQARPIVYRTPLFRYIRQRVQESLSNTHAEDVSGHRSTVPLANDYHIVAQLASRLGDSYLEDVVTLVCTDGVMLEGCESNVQIVVKWLQIECNADHEDKITFIETSVQRHREEMIMIYKAAMSVQALGKRDTVESIALEAKTRCELVDSLHRKVCEMFMASLMGRCDDFASLQNWLVSFQSYFRSKSAQLLKGDDLSWLPMFYTLTAACVVVVFTLSATPSFMSRLLGMIRQQSASATCLRSVVNTLGVIVSSDIFDDCDRSAVYIQTLRWLAVSIPRSAADVVRKDVKELLHVLNGKGVPSKVQLKQVHCNALFITLVQHIDMDSVSWRSLLEEVLQESCSAVCRGCHRRTVYFPAGYPERSCSSECLKKPIADSYFAYHVKSLRTSSFSIESEQEMFEGTASTSTSLIQSIESAAERRCCILNATETLQSVANGEDMLAEGRQQHESLRRVVVFCWGNDECPSLLDSVSGGQLPYLHSRASSLDSLTGDQLSFLNSAWSSVGLAKSIDLFMVSSHPYLKSVVGPALARSAAFKNVADHYMPAVDDELIIEESLEIFPNVRHTWKDMKWHSCYMHNTFYHKLREECSKYLSQSSDIFVQRQCRQTLKMLVMLQSYRIVCSGKHTQCLNAQAILDETEMLNWSEVERTIVNFVVGPSRQLQKAGLQQTSPVFCALGQLRGGSDIEKQLRLTCVNHLFLTVGLGEEESYFGSLMFDPSHLVDRYVFGGTTVFADDVISSRVKLDSSHQYDERGQPLRLGKFLSPQSMRLISVLTFASLLWYVILHDAEDVQQPCFNVLTEDEVMKMEGQTTRDKLVNFCWDKLCQSFRALYRTYDRPSDRVVLTIQHVMSRFAAHHRQGNKTSPFCNSYENKSSRNSAEKYFHKQVFLPVWNKIEERSCSLPQDEGIMQQLNDYYRLKQATAVTHQDFNNALANAVPALPDESPLRALMEEYVMLTLTDKFMPLCRLYVLVHRIAVTEVYSLDESLQAVIGKYAKRLGGDAEQGELKVLDEGIDAFNSILTVTGGDLSANPGMSDDRFAPIGAKTSFRYVCSLPEAFAQDALYRAMARLLSAHTNVLDSFGAYRRSCENERIGRLLSMCDLDDRQTAEVELTTFNGDGLITLERSEFDALLLTCHISGEKEFLSFDFSKVERLIIQHYIMQARRISIERSHTNFVVMRSVVSNEPRPNRTPSPQLPGFLVMQPLGNQFQTSLNDGQKKRLMREIADKTQDECVELLENLALLATTVSADLTMASKDIDKTSFAQFAGNHKLNISGLQQCPLMATTELEYLKSVHTLVSENLVDYRYFHPNLRPLLKEPLPREVANEVSTALDRLSSKSPQIMLQHCECFTNVVKRNFHDIRPKLDCSLVDALLASCETTYRVEFAENLVMTCIPLTVLVKHISHILTFVVRTDASTRQKLMDARKRVMWGFQSDQVLLNAVGQTWRAICLPNDVNSTVSDLVLGHGTEMWKSCEYRRSALFSFNAEVVRVSQHVTLMESVFVVDSCASRKRCKYEIRDGKSKGKRKLAFRQELCQSAEEKLTNRQYLVLGENEQPFADSTNIVTVFKFSQSETCAVCIHVYDCHVTQSSNVDTRVETTREGCVLNAEFATVATVADVLSVVVTLCCDITNVLVTGVIHLRNGKVLENDVHLHELSSNNLQHLCFSTSAKRLFKCTSFSISTLSSCSVIPSKLRDFVCHTLQDVPELRGAKDVDLHSFYLWPPLDDETLCNTIREVCVVPREWLRCVHVSPDSKRAHTNLRLPALPTTTMKTAASYASEKFGIPFDAQILTSSTNSCPIPDYVSVGFAAVRYGHRLEFEPRIYLTQLPRIWRVVVSKSSRELSVSVRSNCVVTHLLDEIVKSTKRGTDSRPPFLDARDRLQLIDSRSMCMLPRLLHLPFCYASNATFHPRKLTLLERSKAEMLPLSVRTCCLDDTGDGDTHRSSRNVRSYELWISQQLPLPTVYDLLDFLSWLPENADAFSARKSPVLRVDSSPMWFQGAVELGDFIRKISSSERKHVSFQLGYSDCYVPEVSPVTVTFVDDERKLSGTPLNMSITLRELRRFAVDFFSIDDQMLDLCENKEQINLDDSWTWDEVISRCKPDETATVTLTFVRRSEVTSADDSEIVESFVVLTETSNYTVRVKDTETTCDIALRDSCNVEEIIQMTLKELSENVDANECVLSVGGFEVEDLHCSLKDILELGESSEQIELELKLPHGQ